MKYLLLLTYAPGTGPQEGTPELDAEMARWGELNEELRHAGVVLGAFRLAGAGQATTVRVRDGETVLTDGPFAETKEILFSSYVLDVPDLDAATAWAAKMPHAAYGSVEIRPMIGDEFR